MKKSTNISAEECWIKSKFVFCRILVTHQSINFLSQQFQIVGLIFLIYHDDNNWQTTACFSSSEKNHPGTPINKRTCTPRGTSNLEKSSTDPRIGNFCIDDRFVSTTAGWKLLSIQRIPTSGLDDILDGISHDKCSSRPKSIAISLSVNPTMYIWSAPKKVKNQELTMISVSNSKSS